jgi:general L-amino acid transport system permease protein
MEWGTGTGEFHPYVAPLPDEPPTRAGSPLEWVRQNLFNTWYNALITIVLAPAIGFVIYRALRFVFVSGRWEIVEVNLTNFMVGLFPRDELWRPAAAVLILAAVIGLGLGVTARAGAEAAAARGATLTTSWCRRRCET